jgi:MoxR-like ATPase
VKLVGRTRANRELATPYINEYLEYGAGPRASQYLIVGAKANALINGKYSPDIEDVQAVAKMVLRHRVVRNYKAEAENISADSIIESIF